MTREDLTRLRKNQPTVYECVIHILFTLGLERAIHVNNMDFGEIPCFDEETKKQIVRMVQELADNKPYDLLVLLAKDLFEIENRNQKTID